MSSFQSVKTIPTDFKCSLRDSRKSYRLIELKNGILTLLISDPLDNTAGGALCVGSGSFNDPDNIIGLAHLCEHAVFLGNKQYPSPQSFFELVNNHNGSTNAYTTGEQTVFHFEIPMTTRLVNEESIYSSVLRNFSSMFQEPIFNEGLCYKEINAVNDEHLSNKGSLDKIMYHGLRILTNDKHPFSRFCTGNSITLNTSNLSKKLESYFNKNYIGNKITLVLKGPQSLNQLQKNAVQHFNPLPKTRLKTTTSPRSYSPKSNRISINSISSPLLIQNSIHQLGTNSRILKDSYAQFPDIFTRFYQLLHIENDDETLYRIVFSYKASIENVDYFERIWCGILGDESEGSLGEYLLTIKKYATSLFCQVLNVTSQDRILTIDITPANIGKKKGQEIIKIIINYIADRLCKVSNSLTRYIIDYHQILKLNYHYQNSDISPMEETAALAETLQSDFNELGLENCLHGFKNINDCDLNDSLIEQFVEISKYTLSNFNVIYVGNLESNIEEMTKPSKSTGMQDTHYQFDYTLHELKRVGEMPSIPIVPNPNEFIPKDNSVIEQSSTEFDSTFQTNKISSLQNPILIDFSKHHEIWYKKEHDIDFESKILTNFSIQRLPLSTSVKADMEILMLCHILGTSLRTRFYPAEILGYQWALYANLNGILSISYSFSGLAFNYTNILKAMIEVMKDFLSSETMSYKQFMNTRITIRQELETLKLTPGVSQAYKGSLIFLEESFWSIEERTDALELIDINDLYLHARGLLGQLKYTRILITGDCEISLCKEIGSIINRISNQENLMSSNIDLIEPKSHIIPEGKNYVFETISSNKSDPMNTVFHYIQVGPRSDSKCRVMAQLLANLFSTTANKELRGKKMIAYAVLSSMRISRSMVGAYIVLMSGSHQTLDIFNEVQSYIFELELRLLKMTDDEFRSVVLDSFKLSNEHQDSQLPSNYFFTTPPCKSSTNFSTDLESSSTHQRAWESIFNKTYIFNNSQEDDLDINFAKELTKGEFMEFFAKHISIKGLKKSSLLIFIESNLSEDDKIIKLKEQIANQLLQSNLTIPDSILDKIIRSNKADNNIIMEQISLYFMDKSAMKFVYKPLKYLKNRKRRIATELEVAKLQELKIMAAKTLGSNYLSDNPTLGVTMIDSIDQLREECQSTLNMESQFTRLNLLSSKTTTNDVDSGSDNISLLSVYAHF